MTTTESPGLTISCAKPGCHWRGSPADAPAHDCPTPASDEGAKPEAKTEPHVHDPRPSFAREREEITGRLDAAGVTYSADATLDQLRGLAQLVVDEPAPAAEPHLADFGDAAAGAPAYDSDPQTREELEAWLAAHGAYGPDGDPADERTAELDARYSTILEQPPDKPPTPEPPPDDPKPATKAKRRRATKKTSAAAPEPEPEPADDEKPQPPPDKPDPPDHAAATSLFDAGDYDDPTLALPQVDGKGIDRIAVAFTGTVMLDRSDVDHVALFRRLKLGETVELWVEGRGMGVATKGATNKDGDLDVVVSTRTIGVSHVRVLGPEDLSEAALEVASQARDAAEAQDARDRRPDDV